MKRLLFVIGISIFCFLPFTGTGAAEKFPFVGKITAKNVNIRAGANINFEALAALAQGDTVVVVERSYAWYKIELPQQVVCYIHSQYVNRQANGSGMVNATRVNVRARPKDNSTILAQLTKGDSVAIVGSDGVWLKIRPAKGCFGWINDSLVSYFSEVKPPEPPKKVLTKEQVQATEQQKKEAMLAEKKKKYSFNAVGVVAPLHCLFGCKGTHKLVDGTGKTLAILSGDTAKLSASLESTVTIWGNATSDSTAAYPLVDVQEITTP